MFGLSLGHIIILLVIVMLFGPKRVSELGGQLGKSLKGIKDSLDDVKQTTGLDKIQNIQASMKEEVRNFTDSVNPLKTNETDKNAAAATTTSPTSPTTPATDAKKDDKKS